ncbi:MAG: HAMP domain-containing sensor histidine kinase [Bacteroidales bacterium]|nr:HAMP domain-containing sensor histidine kinase [Bacteroidales bacterium]MDZ4203415.1 HAMP domain-containing sensor histidine kinase [Bacteroidales bacterium]
MNIYRQKKRWKLILGIIGIIIVSLSLWYSSIMVEQIARDERRNITIWADAIQNRAKLVQYTQLLFDQMKTEERKRVELLAEAYKRIGNTDDSGPLDFYLRIFSDNTTIPVIFTASNGEILLSGNLEQDISQYKKLEGKLKEDFSQYDPVTLHLTKNEYQYVYYKDSHTFTQLREYLDNLVESFFEEVVANSVSVPVIITDNTLVKIIAHGNIDEKVIGDSIVMQHLIKEMASETDPIEIDLAEQGKRYIYYKNSYLLMQLRYYPYFQFGIIAVFLVIAYMLFSTARKSEQNQVWVGLAKETAHQLGTPLSAIMAWIELLKMNSTDVGITAEMEKDVERLQTVTERFSKIGSSAVLQHEVIYLVVKNTVNYLEIRSSKKISASVHCKGCQQTLVPLNRQLFEWVIENLWKNATDAMGGKGKIDILIEEEDRYVIIDFSDTGKGITKSMFKSVFNPGYTSKQRGWGLGLSLARRIVEDYHRGRIFIKSSVIGKGTTFRLMLRK